MAFDTAEFEQFLVVAVAQSNPLVLGEPRGIWTFVPLQDDDRSFRVGDVEQQAHIPLNKRFV